MNFSLSAQQLVHFREHGSIRFSHFPLDFPVLTQSIEEARKKESDRDLWRKSPYLQRVILRIVAPLILQLTGKRGLRIGCDQWFAEAPAEGRIQDLFSFQGLAPIALLYPPEQQLEVFQPSSLTSHILPASYAIVYVGEKAQFIDNPRDPGAPSLKKMGYAYGDFLRGDAHPLVYATRGQV